MSENTKIEWATHSWSPWRGCTKVSEGCANCYAETLSKRNPAVLGEWGKGKPRVLAKNWGDPIRWNGRRICKCGCIQVPIDWPHPMRCPKCASDWIKQRVFPSLCDWLDDEVPIEWLAQFLKLIHDTPHLDWLLLTKRPQNWRQRLAEVLAEMLQKKPWDAWDFVDGWLNGHAPPNVWFGVSVENQKRAEERIPELLKIPAKLRWLSVEPLLGPIEIPSDWFHGYWRKNLSNEGFHWMVIGGESGYGSRPCTVNWIRYLVHRCRRSDVPVFVKQLGANPVDSNNIPFDGISHPKGGDPSEWPEDLRIRQFPAMAIA